MGQTSLPMARMTSAIINPTRFDRSDTLIFNEPFSFMIAHGVLQSDWRTDLARDFPHYAEAGFFPYAESDCGPSMQKLVQRLTAGDMADAIGQRLGIDHLGNYPTLVTLCRSLNRRHGTIHTDSTSKVATALLYLNESWPDSSDGCLRFCAASTTSMRRYHRRSSRCTASSWHFAVPTIPFMVTCPTRASVASSRWHGW